MLRGNYPTLFAVAAFAQSCAIDALQICVTHICRDRWHKRRVVELVLHEATVMGKAMNFGRVPAIDSRKIT